MDFSRIMFGLFVVLLFAGVSFAGCAADAYADACKHCSFDENGKIDKACQSRYQAGGTACVSAAYPTMSAKYAAGQCPAVDECAAELRACTAREGGSNDEAACEQSGMSDCYTAADSCTAQIAMDCNRANLCNSTSFILLAALAGALFFSRK